MSAKTFSIRIGSSDLVVELTSLAGQSNGRVIVRLGETTVLVTAVMSKTPREGGDFFPLTVDYEEKFYAAGKILGSRFVKRENRPSEEAILTARLIDRTIRPRFDLRMRNEVQVVATVLSLDDKNDPDLAALLGASLALMRSDIPWSGPVAGVRIGRRNGSWIIDPSFEERSSGDLDLVVSGTKEKINMLEAGAREIPEADLVEALALAEEEIRRLCAFQEEIMDEIGRPEKTNVPLVSPPEALAKTLHEELGRRMAEALYTKEKIERNSKLEVLKQEWRALGSQTLPEVKSAELDHLWEEELDRIVHQTIIERGVRPDGRQADATRPLTAQAGVLPRVHGSGLFIRGETEALSTVTLGAPGDELII